MWMRERERDWERERWGGEEGREKRERERALGDRAPFTYTCVCISCGEPQTAHLSLIKWMWSRKFTTIYLHFTTTRLIISTDNLILVNHKHLKILALSGKTPTSNFCPMRVHIRLLLQCAHIIISFKDNTARACLINFGPMHSDCYRITLVW